jgi:hypothetical protein
MRKGGWDLDREQLNTTSLGGWEHGNAIKWDKACQREWQFLVRLGHVFGDAQKNVEHMISEVKGEVKAGEYI